MQTLTSDPLLLQRRTRRFLVALLAVLVTSSAPATQTARLVTAEFVAEPIDGDVVTGRIAAIEKGWSITFETKPPLDGSDLVAVRRKDATPPLAPSGAQVLLAGGNRIRAVPQSANQESLSLNSEVLGDIEIPLERTQAILLHPPADARSREQLIRRFSTLRHAQDLVILLNGDELLGSLVGLTEAALQLKSARGKLEVNRSEVRAVALSSELISAPMPTQLYADVLLADGSEFSLLDARLDGATLRGRAAFGRDVIVPFEQVISLEFRNGRLTYLSDLEPVEFQHTPFLNVAYDYQLDRTILGNVLSLRGQTFRKGIGVHSRSELTYELDGRSRRFEALVGVDDETAGRGSVVFRVLLDGTMAWQSRPVTGRSAPLPVRVELGASRRITLVADFADSGDIQDHADWANARLVR